MEPLRIWNYGGGIQSIAIACLVRGGVLPTPDHAIFADTGDEPDEVYKWLDFMQPLIPCPLHIVRRDGPTIMEDVTKRVASGKRLDKPPLWAMGKSGKGAPIGRDCTREWKINVIRKKVKELLGLPPKKRWPKELRVEQWLGISSDERSRMKNSTDVWMRWWHPLIEDEWNDEFWKPKIRHPGVNRIGCVGIIMTTMREEDWDPPTPTPPKSACTHCPYRSNKNWRHLRDSEPHNWQKVVEYDKSLRTGPDGLIHGMRQPVYVHRSCQPLELVDLDENVASAMDEECAGICGV